MNKKDPLVSVIITTHKRSSDLVERAISSVVTQTHRNLEIIVVDDSPADFDQRSAVRAMVESYQEKGAKYIAHKECKGACAARNTGFAEANGEYVAFLDDDDEWLPEKIERQLEKFEDEQTALVYTKFYRVIDSTGLKMVPDIVYLKGFVFDKLLEDNYVGPTSTPLIRSRCLKDIGGFDEKMQSAQDYDVWLRLAKKYAIAYCDEPLMVYHVLEGVRISTNYKKKIAGLERIIEKYSDDLKSHRKAMGMQQVGLTPFYGGDGQLGKALGLWCAGVCKNPGAVIENLRCFKRMFKNYIAYKNSKC